MGPISNRKVGVASGLVVAIAATSLTFFAVTSKGETVHEADLNDGGVWVSSSKDARFARVNKAVGQFDAGVASSSGAGEAVDILQDDKAVAGLVTGTGMLTPIEPKTGRLDESGGASAPAPATATNLKVFVPQTVDLRGGTIAMVEPKTGKVWAQPYDPTAGLEALPGLTAGAKPIATVGANAALAVDVKGGVHAVSGATGTVVSIARAGAGFAKPVTESIKLKDAKAVDITAVGSRWVVYSPVDDKLFAQGTSEVTDGGVAREEGQPAYAALQQPGPQADTVGLQDSTALHLLGFGGGSAGGGVEVKLGDNEVPPLVSRPLRSGSCIHAAWAGTTVNFYGKSCGSAQQPTPALTIERLTPAAVKDGVSLRTNHGLVVLNDRDGGEVWDLDSKPRKLDEWDSLIPPPKVDKDTKKKDENLIDEASQAQPPVAKPDEVRARPGRTSKFHVLDNDTDASGSILSIDPGDVSAPDMTGVTLSVAADGQSIDAAIPADPDKQTFTFRYKINNGKAPQKSAAKVVVTLVPEEENTPPTLRPGTASLNKKVYPVNAGKLLPVQVIGDWRDRESDPLTVEAAADGSSVDGLGRLDVLAPTKRGIQPVEFAVSDGRSSTKSSISINSLLGDDRLVKPETQPDVVRGVVGKPLQIEPLGNDIPGADPSEPDAKMRLSREVPSTGALAIDSNLDTGVVTLTGSSPGSFELSYGAQVGGGISAGRIRVDLIANPDPDAPPVAVPDSATLRDQTPVLTDVLANDYSPRADVLVTRAVSVSAGNDWLRPSIYQGRWVRIEALDPAGQGDRPRTGTVSYTISDGSKSTTGQISVAQFPANDRNVPIVEDDEAVVRAQDTVTIPVMDNDSMADGIPLVLDPASVKVLNGRQTAFASGNVVRYVPENRNLTVQETRTIEYAVYPIGDKSKAQTGRVTVKVMPLPTTATPNQPPVARSFSTSVTAGDPLTVTIPSSGVDPDGDSVTVTGLVGKDGNAVDLELGRVTSFGASTIRYEAYPTSAGTEVLNYEVRDRFGATSRGFVRIGVVQPGDPQPPVAVEDEVRAAPGKTVTVDATQNDLIARGDSVELQYKAPLNPAEELKKWKVDEANTYFTTKVPQPEAGVQHLGYGITNGLFDPSRASISVVPDPGAKNPPTAVDDTAKPKPGETSALVDVLANDRDVDGTPESLKVTSLLSPDGAIEGNQVRVQVKPYPYTIPYVITDEDGLTAMALIHVPTGEAGAPYVTGKVIEMDKDSTESVKLSDYVKSPRGKVVSITTADNLSASPRANLSVEADGRSGLLLKSSNGYIGPGAVMLEVSDQETVDQKDYKTAYVSIPVQVGPKIPLLRCPDFAVTLNAGGLPRDIDIPTLCHAWVPVGMNLDDVAFDSRWNPEPKGVQLTRTGAGDRGLELRADRDAPSSVDGRLVINARGGPESTIRVTVVGLNADGTLATDAAGNPIANVGPPRMRPFAVSGLKAGSSQSIDLRGYLDSPLEKPDCSIVAASAPSGSGLTVSRAGCTLTVSASPDAHGKSYVNVSVADAPGRAAQGRGTVEILGKPGAPTSVQAEADRVNGGSARVRWLPPALDGGSPVTRYVVTVNGPGGGAPRDCTASPCTITGLTDGQWYTFTVAAVNAIGTGPASGASNRVMPDTLPNRPTGVRMAGRGDGSLQIAWSAPAPKGSAVTSYQVRVTDTTTGEVRQPVVPASTLQTTVSGLVNDHEQSVQVRAKNGLGYGPFSDAVKMQSAGTPPAVPAPNIANAGAGPADDSARLTITWSAVTPNGPPLTHYTVYRSRNGSAWAAIGTRSPGSRSYGDTIPYDGASYRYVITATNGANNESPKSNPSSFSSVGTPEVPGAPSVTTPSANNGATVRVSLGDSRSGGFTQLQWRTDDGRSGSVGCGCAENSTEQFSLTGLGNQSQRIQVRVYNGNTWSAYGSWSNSYQPYGATPVPGSFNGSRSGDNPVWTWNLRTNGRPITDVEWDGSFNGSAGAIERLERNGSAGNTYNLRVRARSAAGWSGWTSFVSVTIPDSPKVTVLKGSTCGERSCNTGNGSCSGSACRWIAVRTANFSGGVTCTFREDGGTVSGWRDLSMGGNAYAESDNFYGIPGHTITAICDGVRDSITW